MHRLLAKAALPFVSAWVRRHERRILRHGRPLAPAEQLDAQRVGVREPERVRVLTVESIPPHLPRPLRLLAQRCGLGPSQTAGMALGYGIYLRTELQHERPLLLHELVHTAQYERLGMGRFLEEYVHECLTSGYPLGPLEAEARRVAEEVSKR